MRESFITISLAALIGKGYNRFEQSIIKMDDRIALWRGVMDGPSCHSFITLN